MTSIDRHVDENDPPLSLFRVGRERLAARAEKLDSLAWTVGSAAVAFGMLVARSRAQRILLPPALLAGGLALVELFRER